MTQFSLRHRKMDGCFCITFITSCLFKLSTQVLSKRDKHRSQLANMLKRCLRKPMMTDAQYGVAAGDDKQSSSATSVERFLYNSNNEKKRRKSVMVSLFLGCVWKQMLILQPLTQTHIVFCHMFWRTTSSRKAPLSPQKERSRPQPLPPDERLNLLSCEKAD